MEFSQAVVPHQLDIVHLTVESRARIVYVDTVARTPCVVFNSYCGDTVGDWHIHPVRQLRDSRTKCRPCMVDA